VRLSGDGVLVLLHDDRVDRTTDGKGAAASMTCAELERLDAGCRFAASFAGERIPTLRQTLELARALRLGIDVEIKAARGAEAANGRAVGAALAEFWPAPLPAPLVTSFKPAALEACREVAPDLARGLIVKRIERGWRATLDALGCRTLIADHKHLDEGRVAEIRQAGIPLLAYTINDAARAQQLLSWGVATVISDRPEIASALEPARECA
jgi:glycerophosphoryl diester phosphodiesterase